MPRPIELQAYTMTKRMKTILGVIAGIVAVVVVFLLMRGGGRSHPAKDSIFVRQRMDNLRKGQ